MEEKDRSQIFADRESRIMRHQDTQPDTGEEQKTGRQAVRQTLQYLEKDKAARISQRRKNQKHRKKKRKKKQKKKQKSEKTQRIRQEQKHAGKRKIGQPGYSEEPAGSQSMEGEKQKEQHRKKQESGKKDTERDSRVTRAGSRQQTNGRIQKKEKSDSRIRKVERGVKKTVNGTRRTVQGVKRSGYRIQSSAAAMPAAADDREQQKMQLQQYGLRKLQQTGRTGMRYSYKTFKFAGKKGIRYGFKILKLTAKVMVKCLSAILGMLLIFTMPLVILLILIMGVVADEGIINPELPIPLYVTCDIRWSDLEYGDETIETRGSLLCTVGMAASYILDTEETPDKVLSWCGNQYYSGGDSLLEGAAEHYNLTITRFDNFSEASSELMQLYLNEDHKPVLVAMTRGHTAFGEKDCGVLLVPNEDWQTYTVYSPLDSRDLQLYYSPKTYEAVEASCRCYYILDIR